MASMTDDTADAGRAAGGAAGPEGGHGGTEYATYLLVDDLLALQRPLTPGAHDELLFIVVHQAYELWFKLLLHELRTARDRLANDDVAAAVPPLVRVCRVDELLVAQLGVLETMTPEGFLEFRDPLTPASGFQSRQFRAIEAVCGRGEGSLWGGFCAAGRGLGLDMPGGDGVAARERCIEALVTLYRDHREVSRASLHRVCELLVDHDEAVLRWRFRHSLMAAREIGDRAGTGGSLGVAYLRTTVDRRFFDELWEVRSRL